MAPRGRGVRGRDRIDDGQVAPASRNAPRADPEPRRPGRRPTGRAPRHVLGSSGPVRLPGDRRLRPETHLLELTPVRPVGRVPTRHRAQRGHRLALVAAHPRPHVDRDRNGRGVSLHCSALGDTASGERHTLRRTPVKDDAVGDLAPSRIAFGRARRPRSGPHAPEEGEGSPSRLPPRAPRPSRARTRRTVSRSSSSAPRRHRPFRDRGSAGPPSARTVAAPIAVSSGSGSASGARRARSRRRVSPANIPSVTSASRPVISGRNTAA